MFENYLKNFSATIFFHLANHHIHHNPLLFIHNKGKTYFLLLHVPSSSSDQACRKHASPQPFPTPFPGSFPDPPPS
jgi:hypothetical protein